MANIDVHLFLVIIALPVLFSSIFFIEGFYKMSDKESPTGSFFMGFVFVVIIIAAYIFLFTG